ncbi:MAG TPA: hypothetical protein VKZ60_17800 [Chloroflexota bacterium]|nr:hypothetical protein [Chloroflexota bacterium]
MTSAMATLITVLNSVLVVAFVWALWSLHTLPLGHRPLTRKFDRFGRFQALGENPDYHENPSEEQDDTELGATRARARS